MAHFTEQQDLVPRVQSVADGIDEAIGWATDAENAKLIGERGELVQRELRRSRLQARKLLEATAEPMAVAVFGPSQVGKSHLISVLARTGDTLQVDFGGRTLNYIKKINPDSGKEATGLVSRFTVRDVPSLQEFPVSIRLLSPADLVKILANSYIYEGNPARYESWPSVEDLRAHIDQFRAHANSAEAASGISQDDVWDIGEYLELNLMESQLTKNLSNLWPEAAPIAGRLSVPQAARFWSILWGRHQALTELFEKLIGALSHLKFSSHAFCPLDAIDATKREPLSILDAESLRYLGDSNAPRIAIARPDGKTIELDRSVIAALTAEIRFKLSDKPWDFFDHTDLLDFPGYRGRGLEPPVENDESDGLQHTGLAHHLSRNRAKTIQEMLLRGKVEYLFQRYMAEQAVSAMLLCAKPSNMDVKKLPEVISNWISTTHGARPQDRLGKPTLLFFIFTMFDIHFGRKESDSSLGLDRKFDGRIKASLIEPFGRSPESWVQRWAGDAPFTNSFLMRNPSVREASGSIFVFEGDREKAIRPEQESFIRDLRSAFASVELVRHHFVNPERAFDELMGLNDGGATYIAKHLAAVCRPDIKPRQIEDRLERLRQRTISTLGQFYTSTDAAKRVEAREQMAHKTRDALDESIDNHRFGMLLQGLMLDGADLADRLSEFLIRRPSDNDVGASAAGATISNTNARSGIPRPGGGIPRPGGPITTAPPSRPESNPSLSLESRSSPEYLARIAMRAWFKHLDAVASDELFAADVLVPTATIREIVGEIIKTAVNRRLSQEILRDIEALKFVERLEERLAKASVIIEHRLNQFVASFGFDRMPETQRPLVDWITAKTPIFQERRVTHTIDDIREEPRQYRAQFIADWTHALHALFIENARNAAGLDPANAKQNDRLGAILKLIGYFG
ncbi:hypothetical protein HL666_20035 [Bradyrhizobium sp. 83002]|uniref:virulence factor SrfC family protein n=1 Tax=Bradyrhizobium aeschynomenes TaxID=2734909 RepID=UPI0015533C05|nr:virulence factor SrfC family protein [Bradyrhizobium aeschynomenes]NPU13063.1 hypothetical protein [Bradyrhizobium aeschynomenes]